MRRVELERALEGLPQHPEPRAELEQYQTPPQIASELLWHAYEAGDIVDRRILDLGCGTGTFAIGAALLGCRGATGIDVDQKSIEAARDAAKTLQVDATTEFHVHDVAELTPSRVWHADTVLMNPPFGAQRSHADRPFYEVAANALGASGGNAWFLAQPKTGRFLDQFATRLGGTLESVDRWQMPLPARYAHHQRDVATIDVAAYRLCMRSTHGSV